MILRDSHGIAQVKSVTGSKILRILKAHGMTPFVRLFVCTPLSISKMWFLEWLLGLHFNVNP